ncbi:MAG: hypothetical protein ACAH80_01455 [Alphaproteobacteria bacterium]
MDLIKAAVDFIPNVMKRSMYMGHQLGDVVLPRMLQKVGFSQVASELASLPITAVGAGAALWVGGSNLVLPFFGILTSAIFNPVGLAVFVPVGIVFGALTCAGIGMGDVLLKKFGKPPIFDGIYDNLAYRSERKVKLAEKAKAAKAAAELEQQRALDAGNPNPAAAATPQGNKAFSGFEPGTDTKQPTFAGARNAAAGSFNTASTTDGGVPKFAGFPPTVDSEQGPRERPERPPGLDKKP